MNENDKDLVKRFIKDAIHDAKIKNHKHCKKCETPIEEPGQLKCLTNSEYALGYEVGVCIKCILKKGIESFIPKKSK